MRRRPISAHLHDAHIDNARRRPRPVRTGRGRVGGGEPSGPGAGAHAGQLQKNSQSSAAPGWAATIEGSTKKKLGR